MYSHVCTNCIYVRTYIRVIFMYVCMYICVYISCRLPACDLLTLTLTDHCTDHSLDVLVVPHPECDNLALATQHCLKVHLSAAQLDVRQGDHTPQPQVVTRPSCHL